jgi:hypothetical protein
VILREWPAASTILTLIVAVTARPFLVAFLILRERGLGHALGACRRELERGAAAGDDRHGCPGEPDRRRDALILSAPLAVATTPPSAGEVTFVAIDREDPVTF